MLNRKIIGIFIVTLLIATAIPAVGNIKESINEESKNDLLTWFDKCECDNYIQNLKGDKFYLMSNAIIPSTSRNDFTKSSLVDLPEYFNWMDYEGYDWTTPAKNQGDCGSCWDFAAVGALESLIKIKEELPDLYPDLSEQYVLSCLPASANYYGEGCMGGDPYNAYRYIMNASAEGNYCNGIIPESCFPYQADHNIPCSNKCEDWEDYLIPITNNTKLLCGSYSERELNKIKTVIIERGPVASGINVTSNFSMWGWTHHNPTDYYSYYPSPSGFLNHIVVIVGWKDDSSIPNGGYWICKNSWGDIWGYNGFFNIEYGGYYIGFHNVYADYDPDKYYWAVDAYSNGPYYGLTNNPVEFSGDAAAGAIPYTWHWDFGDGYTSEEQNPSHTYIEPGEYIVTFTVADYSGDFSTDYTSTWIQESNTPPNLPNIEGPTEIVPEEYCWYNISAVDPDGSEVYIYAIAFDIDCGVWFGPYESGEEDKWYYYWAERGTFTVKAKAKDPYGAESDWATLEVSVPKNKAINTPFLDFLENHPYLFPLLRQLMGL